ncbi:LysM peptidoglycan-binding domain-containing protein [Actinomadura rudentiformis]|uniref:LysM peptidoglycan-binding domain-containing protein n=1 Tax=Actinomadura rudentiformis TaxID=359158 RepID=A0A6H9YNJ2_9ACTN|nr:LysM peptidoglycan-binding domain-containing protein [Actinomadura rudentiformis]KAB2346387.1 LysM peptidoglycan-binding domain-containing protein [Actinomadura rudentiformis]
MVAYERASDPGIRLTRRGRAVLTAFAACTLLVAFWLTEGPGARAGDGGHAPAHRQTVVVEPGETLWDIAARHAPDSDPRRTVDRIIDLNSLSSPVVQPGQQLRLPAR